jgi:hypothetical protein
MKTIKNETAPVKYKLKEFWPERKSYETYSNIRKQKEIQM